MDAVPAGGIVGKQQLQDAAVIALSTPRVPTDLPGSDTPRWEMLYANASDKAKRLDERRQQLADEEQRRMEKNSVHRSAASGALGSAKDGKKVPCWSRLTGYAADKEKRLEEQRRQLAELERVWLEENSIHTAKSADTGVSAQRLYEDAAAREKRLVDMRHRIADEERRRLEVRSIHLHDAEPLSEYSREQVETKIPRWQRLHGLAVEREAHLQEKRRKLEEEEQRWLDKNTVHGEGGAMRVVVDAYERERDRLRSPRGVGVGGAGPSIIRG